MNPRTHPPPQELKPGELLQDVPIADAQPEEIQELLGGALFKALYKWMIDSGPVYLLPTGSSAEDLGSRPKPCKSFDFQMTTALASTLGPVRETL